MRVSVVIPTADRPDCLERLLASLAAQAFPRDGFEVVVVDDGTAPPVAPLVASFGGRLDVHYVWQPRSGPAKARNRAIALARGELLLILNDDASAPPDLLARHAAAHAASAKPAVFLGGFDLAPGCVNAVSRGLLELGLPFPFFQMRRDAPNPGRFFWTCNLSVPRAAVVAAGGFDEGFTHPVCEDVELGMRLEKRGLLVHWLEGAPCLHHHVLTAKWFWRRQVLLGASMVQLWRKHRDPALLPGLARAKGDVRLLEASLDHLARKSGAQARALAAELDLLPEGALAPHESLAPRLRAVDASALHVGLLAGLRGQSFEEAVAWLESTAAPTAAPAEVVAA